MKKLLSLLIAIGLWMPNIWAQSLTVASGTLNIGVINTGESSPDGAHWFQITGAGYNPYEIIYVDSPSLLFTVSESGLSGTYNSALYFTANSTGAISQNIYVKYSPEVAGVVATQLTIYEFQTFVFHYKSLQGIGKAPEIMMEGRESEGDSWVEIVNNDNSTTLTDGTNFGETAYGVATSIRKFKVTNNLPLGGLNGDLLLFEFSAGKTIEITGPEADQFSVELEPASVVYPNYDTTYFKIAFTPTSFGLKSAFVNIANNDGDEDPFVFAISGLGIIEPAGIPVVKKASVIDNNSFQANWLPGTGGTPTGYLLDVSDDPTFFDFLPGYQAKNVGNTTAKSIAGLVDATNYYFRVRAYKPGDTSTYSQVMSLKTAPEVPTVLPASIIEQSAFYANWSFVSEATAYRVDVNTSPDFTGFAALQNATATANYLHIEGLTGGVTYYYRVRSFNGASSENSAVISAVTLPEKPVAKIATQIIDEGFTANWSFSNPIFAEGFLLDISTAPDFSSFVPGYENFSVGPFLQAYIIGLNPTSTYYYRVRTRYENDTTDYSNIISVITTSFAPEVQVSVKVFMEGPFGGGQMSTMLNDQEVLPTSQPYATGPWNYNGSESVGAVPSTDIVDWVLLRLLKRDDVDTSMFYLLGTEAAWLQNDGQVINYSGAGAVGFKTVVDGNYYIQVFHRNHLPVISALPLTEDEGVYTYDFTLDNLENSMQYVGQKELMTGVWGMIAADADGNGEINTIDNNGVWYPAKMQSGYLRADYNLDGTVDELDKAGYWKMNVGKGVSSQNIQIVGDNL
ncbi:MAG TPA: fibronectin type III domain-containing protein [Bacteroidales bacterium]|nr:fibronectin type III domain-containing protein [Bacteroidales bacterium]